MFTVSKVVINNRSTPIFMKKYISVLRYLLDPPGPSWLWSYGSWIYNYLCNQCLSQLKLSVITPFVARCTRYNIMW